jgi:hypothetical protein
MSDEPRGQGFRRYGLTSEAVPVDEEGVQEGDPMFQRQYEDEAEVLMDGEVGARGYARLELMLADNMETWAGTFRITEPGEPPPLEGTHLIRLRDGAASEAELAPAEDISGEASGLAGSFLEVRGLGPCPF